MHNLRHQTVPYLWPNQVAKFLSAIILATGIFVIIGWLIYFWLPENVLYHLKLIEPNSALCFILSGMALWKICEEPEYYSHHLVKLCASVVFLISVLTLLEHFFNINLGIDQGIFNEPLAATKNIFPPGRMAPFAAVSFSLIGFTLFFLDNKFVSYRVYHPLIIFVIFSSFFSLLVHIYKINNSAQFFGIDRYSQMPMISIFLFLLLSVGIFMARPGRGIASLLISRYSGGLLTRRLIPPAVIFPIVLGYLGLLGVSGTIYAAELGISLLVMGTVTFFIVFILFNAYLVEKYDITRRRLEKDLKINKNKLQTFFDNTGAVIYSYDFKGIFLSANKAFEKLFHKSEKDVIGKTVFDLFPKNIADRVRENNLKLIRLKSPMEMEDLMEIEGEWRTYITNKFLLYDDQGVAYAIGNVASNVTEMRRAKEIAEKLAEQADAASRAKSAFLAAMSHEIRTPLNGVIGMTSLLLDTILSMQQREYVETIRVSGEALLLVINDILDFSKIESEHMEIEKVDFSIYALIEDSLDIFTVQAHNKGIAFGAYIDPAVPEWLVGDSMRIRQVLNNILSNAVKFTESGEISINVRLIKTAITNDKKLTLLIEVKDTGIGITPEAYMRLFEPFMQGDTSISRKYGGTGLGLAISKRLVELMGGTINVESELGRGSKFWFTIELAESTHAITPKIDYALIKQIHGARILCVDDNVINREIIQRQTKNWHMRCDLAENAAEALSMLKKAAADRDPYVLALVDYMMPGMSGFELIQIMRQLPEIKNVPVIILSSLGASFSINELKRLGISLSLSKPLHLSRLYESITTVLIKMRGKVDTLVSPTQIVPVQPKKHYRILLAEDNITNKQVALWILERLGYHADSVSNGYEAIQTLKNTSYDLILMDCQMPGMDGYTATAEIRKMEGGQQPHIPIIAMTAHALKGDREKCLQVGMDDYISKPINFTVLTEMLSRWLDEKLDSQQKLVAGSSFCPVEENTVYIDPARIQEIFGENKENIREFLQVFISSTAELLADITEAIKAKDSQLAKELLHRLKGSSGDAGIKLMHKLAMEAEEKAIQLEWDTVIDLYQNILDTFEKVKLEAATDRKS